MNLQGLKEKILNLGKSGGTDGVEERRFDGGTSCYRPNRRRAREDMHDGNYAEQNVHSLHTGFTGMNPPEDGAYYADANSTEAANGYDGTGYGMNAQTDYSRSFSSATPADNISYMKGNAPRQENRVERIMVLTSLKTCYDAIGCMKNGETLILSLDAIANDSEIIRCEDMLAGAAFTLGCTVRLLPGTGHLILVVPSGVTVLPEEARRARQAAPAAQAIPMNDGAYTANEQPVYQPRRERRSSQNTQNWKSFENGIQSNTGYYGQEPVPTGTYTTYGGYGY